MKPTVKVKHPEQVYIKDQPVGTVFANGVDSLMIKTQPGTVFILGGDNHGMFAPYTPQCRSFVALELSAVIAGEKP